MEDIQSQLLQNFIVSFAGLSRETIALATSVSLVLILVAASGLLAFCCLQKKKKEKERKQPIDEDMNPVYGLYYFSDGERVDDSSAEVVDENSYYD